MADEKTAEKVVQMPVKPEEHIYGSLDEILSDGAAGVEYKVIDGFKPGSKIRIGSVSAGDVLEWSDTGDDDKEAKKLAGLRLLCKSLVNETGERYAMKSLNANIQKLKEVRHKETERCLRAVLELNGMNVKTKPESEAKKD